METLLTGKEIQDAFSDLAQGKLSIPLLKSNIDSSVKISMFATKEEASPKAEIHDNFNDIFVVCEGKEEFWVGGDIIDKVEIEPGEWLGEEMRESRSYKLEKGDIFIVPKGVSHKHGLGRATFLVIKTK